MMGLSDGRKSFPIGLAVLIQYRSVTASQPATQPATQLPSHVAVAITLNAKVSSLKIVLSPYLTRESSKFGMRTKILTKATEMWENLRNSQIQDGGRTPYWKSLFGYNSAPYYPIKTKFRVWRLNRTHTKVWWWKCQISKIENGGRPPFWKSL